MAPPEEAATAPQAAPGTVIRRRHGLLVRGRRSLARMPKGGGRIRPVMAGLGAFLIVFGLLLRFYVAPRLIAAPPGFSIMISLVAPHASYFDESTLTTQRDATLTYNETIRGDPGASTGTIAVWDQFTVLEDLRRNIQLIATFQRSAFNRSTGELTNCCGASVNDDTRVRQDGIGVAFWPIGTQKTTYRVYDTNTERAWPAAYSGTEVVQGLLTYRFTQRIPVTVVQQMPGVPTSLLGLPGPSRNVVADRTFQASITFWVDPRTGVPIKAEERILSVLRGPGGQGRLTVADADLTMTPDSQRALAAVARQNAASITTLRQVGPLGGLLLGFLLVLAGTVSLRRLPRRARRNPAGPQRLSISGNAPGLPGGTVGHRLNSRRQPMMWGVCVVIANSQALGKAICVMSVAAPADDRPTASHEVGIEGLLAEIYADPGPCFSPSIARLVWGPMASSWLCTTTHWPAISRQTLVFLIRVNSVPEVVAKVTSK